MSCSYQIDFHSPVKAPLEGYSKALSSLALGFDVRGLPIEYVAVALTASRKCDSGFLSLLWIILTDISQPLNKHT